MPDLVSALAHLDAGAAVFPLSDPSGYRAANDAVLEAAEHEPALVPFCRLTPGDDPAKELERCLDAGAAGIKLHPASDEFAIDDDRLTEVYGAAGELGLPVVLHGGPENDPMGDALTAILGRFPGMRIVLAHAGLTNSRACPARTTPTSSSTRPGGARPTCCACSPPCRRARSCSAATCRTPARSGARTPPCAARYTGLDDRQIRSVMGEQARRLVARTEPLHFGSAPGAVPVVDPLLERVYVYLAAGVEVTKRGDDPDQALDLARHCCRVPEDHPDQATFAAVLALLDTYAEHVDRLPKQSPYAPGWDLIATAAVVARTPLPAASR